MKKTYTCKGQHRGCLTFFQYHNRNLGGGNRSANILYRATILVGFFHSLSAQVIEWLEAVARGWNAHPTPFVWAGKRALRRQRARERHYIVSGSGATSCQPIPNQGVDLNGDKQGI